MSELKTKPSDQDVTAFLDTISETQKRIDAQRILHLMQHVTQMKPELWGSAIIGFGRYRYRYESGHSGESFLTGFSPRKQALTLYIMGGVTTYTALLDQLGKHSVGKSCLYIKRLSDVDLTVLEELIRQSVAHMQITHVAE